jgi:hypothetical protein
MGWAPLQLGGEGLCCGAAIGHKAALHNGECLAQGVAGGGEAGRAPGAGGGLVGVSGAGVRAGAGGRAGVGGP